MKKKKPTTGKRASKPAFSSMSRRRKDNSLDVPADLGDWIARKAYELYEQRGWREGGELEDWLDAEAIVMAEIHKARKPARD